MPLSTVELTIAPPVVKELLTGSVILAVGAGRPDDPVPAGSWVEFTGVSIGVPGQSVILAVGIENDADGVLEKEPMRPPVLNSILVVLEAGIGVEAFADTGGR